MEPPPALALTDPALPIDDKAGGCDTHDAFFKAWKRETPKLHIADSDVVSDKGPEIYSLLRCARSTICCSWASTRTCAC